MLCTGKALQGIIQHLIKYDDGRYIESIRKKVV